jgi:hypothetical protein
MMFPEAEQKTAAFLLVAKRSFFIQNTFRTAFRCYEFLFFFSLWSGHRLCRFHGRFFGGITHSGGSFRSCFKTGQRQYQSRVFH